MSNPDDEKIRRIEERLTSRYVRDVIVPYLKPSTLSPKEQAESGILKQIEPYLEPGQSASTRWEAGILIVEVITPDGRFN